MAAVRRTGVRRHLSLLVSVALVVVIGGLGLVAGHAARAQALDMHRGDRLQLQLTLAGLVEQYTLLNAAEVVDALDDGGPWSTQPDDPASTSRLERLVTGTRALDSGALLLSPTGQRLALSGAVPMRDDAGWASLRAALAAPGALPLSGVLTTAGTPQLAMGLPVPMADGTRGLVVGLWQARDSGLQQYVTKLSYGSTGRGYIVDAAGNVLAGPDPQGLGLPLPVDGLLERVLSGPSGLADTGGLVTSFAPVGETGWTALTPQDRGEFEGALARSGRLVQVLVVALLLSAGAGLVVLHRKRETALERVALHDELTGLYNRRGWFTLAEHELARARRQASPRVLLFIDLDGLKQVNDQLGHREGDRALAAAAQVLTAASRSSDLVGRLGGDEFVLLLGEDGRADVARTRLVAALAEHNSRSTDSFELRLSLGAEVWFPDAATSLSELVRRADADMYVHKSARPERSRGVIRLPAPHDAADEDSPVSLDRLR